jgi:hypothetical protein
MRSRSNIGLGFLTKLAIFIIVVIGFLALIGWLLISSIPPTPLIAVSGVSINPSMITQSESSTLNFTIKNNDAESPHQVTVEFNATSVIFNIDNENLTYNDGLQYYTITLQSSQNSTYSFKVFGELNAAQAASAHALGASFATTYFIPIYFVYQNGTKFDTEIVSLTVH